MAIEQRFIELCEKEHLVLAFDVDEATLSKCWKINIDGENIDCIMWNIAFKDSKDQFCEYKQYAAIKDNLLLDEFELIQLINKIENLNNELGYV